MSFMLIVDREISIAPYFKDIEDIYVENGWGLAYPPELLSRMFANCYYILAIREGKAVGFIRAFTDNATVTHLSELAVHPSHQRQGVGEALVKKFVADLGGTTVYLETPIESVDLLFTRHGFSKKSKLNVYARKAR
ncbi:MAG: N-acetyltransferase [Alcaligenaceae bacterium]|nr:MAG: N-acetyltransferase [Alcaligenaceae bacterium]